MRPNIPLGCEVLSQREDQLEASLEKSCAQLQQPEAAPEPEKIAVAAQETPADLLQDPKLSKWAKGVKYRRQDPETVATQMRQSMVPEDQIARFLEAYGKTPLAPVVKSTEPAEKDNRSGNGPGQGKGDRGKGGKGPAGRGKGGPATDPVLSFKSAP